MENLRARKQLNLDNPDDVDWLHDWAKLAQKELTELREKVSQMQAPVIVELAELLEKEISKINKHLEKPFVQGNADVTNYWDGKAEGLKFIREWNNSKLSK